MSGQSCSSLKTLPKRWLPIASWFVSTEIWTVHVSHRVLQNRNSGEKKGLEKKKIRKSNFKTGNNSINVIYNRYNIKSSHTPNPPTPTPTPAAHSFTQIKMATFSDTQTHSLTPRTAECGFLHSSGD